MRTWLLTLALGSVLSVPSFCAPDQNIPLTLYTQLASSAQSAKGSVSFALGQGMTITRIPGTADIKWIVPRAITATAEFEYVDGQWKSLRLSFSDWIEASFREGTVEAQRQKLSAIVFENGGPDDYFDEGDQPVGRSLSAFPEVRSHLRVPNGPASLLLANLFAGMERSPSPINQGLSPTTVTIQTNGKSTGVTLVAKSQSVLSLSSDPPGDLGTGSWLRLGAPTSISITTLSFIPIESVIQFQLGFVSTALANARLGFGDTALVPSADARLSFDGLDANSTKPDAVLTITAGSFLGKLGGGTAIQLTRNSLGATSFAPRPLADSSIKQFTLSVQRNGIGTLAASHMTVPVGGQNAAVVFDHLDMLALNFNSSTNPILSIDEATWTGGQFPIAVGRLSSFTAAVTGGVLALDRSRLRVKAGSVAANGLRIGEPNSNTVTGILQQLAFTVDTNSVIDAGAGAAFRISSGGAAAAGSDQALMFDSGQDGPVGTVTVTGAAVQNGVLRFGDQALLAVSSDKADFTAIRDQSVTNWSMSGTVNVSTGSFVVDTVGTFLVQGGTISLSNLAINDAGAVGGSITAADLAIGSQTITYGDNFSVVAVGTSRLQLNLGGPVIVSGNGNLAGGLSLSVPILTGTIRLGKVGVVNLKGGSVNFVANASADLTAQVSVDVSLQVASGDLRIPPGGDIVLGEGTIVATGMIASPNLGLVGGLGQADLAILTCVFSLANGLQFNTKSGRFTTAENFTISSDGQSVSGPLSLKTTLDKLTTGTNAGLTVSGGEMDLELLKQNDGSLVTQSNATSYLRGAGVHFQTPKGDSVDLSLNLENVRLTASPGEPATLISDLRGEFTKFSLSIQTDPKEGYHDDHGDHNNARFFTLTMSAALDSTKNSVLSIDGFSLTAGQPVPPMKPTVYLTLTLPPGDGEHPNSSIHEGGNHGGPDRMHNAQEAFTDTYPACRIHVYLFQGTYQVAAAIDLTPVWSGGKPTVSSINLTPPITRNTTSSTQGWDRDGCDGPFEKIVVVGFASIIGAALAGPVGSLALAGASVALINFAEDRLDNWVNAWLVSRIQSLQLTQQ